MLRVLLVDDEHLEREALKIILKEASDIKIVGEAATGTTAVQMCDATDPDMILMDIRMPGMDGIEATDIIKSNHREKVVLVMSTYDDFPLIQKAMKLGADGYLIKPARPKDILGSIEKAKRVSTGSQQSADRHIEELLHRIHTEDYKGAKEQLKALVQLFRTNYDNVEQVKKMSKVIADGMLKICKAKGVTGIESSSVWSQMNETVTLYTLYEYLIMLLDHIFDEMIKHSSLQESNQIQAVLNYIEMNYQRGVTLEEAADYVHLSPHYLSKLFKKELDINFVNYVVERRMELAKELLEHTDMPVLNIALELSYQEHNYFSKVFKKVVGMTPSEYRKEKEKDKEALLKKYAHISNGKWYV